MSASLLDTLRAQIELLIVPVTDAAGDVGACRRLLAALGADDSLSSNATLLRALQAAVDLETQLEAVFSAPEPSFAGVSGGLAAISDLFAALRGLDDTSEQELQRLGTDIVALLCGEYLRMTKPMLYRVGALLTLVTPIEEAGMGTVANGSVVVRRPFPCALIRFDQLSPLVTSPEKTLAAFYFPNGLVTEADANAAADVLFPRIGDVLTRLGVPWSYGVPDEDLAVLGDAAPFVDHAFQIYIPSSVTGANVDAGITFTLSSQDRGGLGLVMSPFGSLQFSTSVNAWTFDAKLGAEIEALALGSQGPTFIASADTVTIDASFTVALTPPASGAPAYIFGSTTGTRLELGTVKFAVAVEASLTDATVSASASVSSGALVIAADDGDSFLQAVLPAGGLRATFDLGITYSTKGGLAFSGGAGLDATIPVNLSLGGVIALQGIHLALSVDGNAAHFETSAIASLDIGPLQVVIDRMGIATTLAAPPSGGNLGILDLQFRFKPPEGAGLAIDTAGLTGGGFLSHDEATSQYAGMLQLSYQGFQLQAFGLIATKLPSGPGYSMVAMVDATFPPIELVAGFTLNGVGGLLGINRTVSTDALAAGIKAKTLSTFLFSKNPVVNAAQLLTDLATFFPAAPGRYVFGPLLQIGWGTPTAITIDLALVLELPDPIRLVLIGELTVLLPNPSAVLLEMHMDVLGTADFGTDEGSLDAVLHDSRLVQYPLQGSMALRSCWSGSDKMFLLSVGGFNPKFQPPPGFPALQRVSVSMPSGHISKLTLDGYFAVSSNTLQLGAGVDLFVGVDGFGIAGYLNFDTLIGWNPFYFDGDISGGVMLSVDHHDVMSLDMSADLTGPAPWHCAGKVHFSVLGFGVTKHFSATFGSSAPAQPTDSIDVGAQVRAALSDPRNFTATLAANQNGLVSLLMPTKQGEAVGHPAAGLKVMQRVVPLGLAIQKFGAAAPSGDTQFTITAVTADGTGENTTPVQDAFAPAQFLNMSDDDELASPSFETFDAGVSLADGALRFGNANASGMSAIVHPVSYETYLVDTPGGDTREDTGLPVPPERFSGIVWTLNNSGRLRYTAPSHAMVKAAKLDYVVATTDQIAASSIGNATGQTYAQAHAALREATTSDPAQLGALQVVPLYEVTHG